jgi:plasmid maintenance system antidote protein VapI
MTDKDVKLLIKLNDYIEREGIRQSHLANKWGITRAFLNAILLGKRNLNPELREKIKQYLKERRVKLR